jgi:flagellar FliL protein
MADEDDEKEDNAGPVEASLDDNSEGAENADEEGEKKKSKKPLIIAVAALLLLVGGGAGAYFTGMLDSVLGGGSEAGEEHGDDHDGGGDDHAAADDGHGGGHGDDHGGGHGGRPVFLVIPDQRVNLNSSDGSQSYLQLRVQLELASEGDKHKVEAVLPRVIDQFQTYLRELRVQDLRGSQGPQRLATELLIRVNQAAAPVEVKDVLFQEMLIQEN